MIPAGNAQADTRPAPHADAAPRRRWRTAAAIALVSLIVMAAGLAAGWAWRAKQASAAAAEARGKAVVALEFTPSEVVRPVHESMPERIEFSGPLTAPRTAVVRAKAAGTLLDLKVGEGSRVRAGQSLGTIDLADLQSRVAERSAMVEAAEARQVEAERSHQANENLAQQQFISANALSTSRAGLDAARAQVKSAQAQLNSSRLGIREAQLTAPIAGLVGKRSVVPGEKVSAEQELMTVVDLRSLELVGVVGTHQVSLLAPGQAVSVRVEGATQPVAGRIDRIAPAAEPGMRGIRVIVVLDNPDESFRAGQFASVDVVRADPTRRLTLPASAVGQESGQAFVWTVERGALVRRLVVTGRRDAGSGRVEVIGGLPAETPVLGVRFEGLKEGAAAKLVAQRAAPTAASAATAPTASAASSTLPNS